MALAWKQLVALPCSQERLFCRYALPTTCYVISYMLAENISKSKMLTAGVDMILPLSAADPRVLILF